MAFRFEDLGTSGDGLGDVDDTLAYETDDTLELSHQEEAAKEVDGGGAKGKQGSVGKKRELEVRVPDGVGNITMFGVGWE